jgi:hypothetical protein
MGNIATLDAGSEQPVYAEQEHAIGVEPRQTAGAEQQDTRGAKEQHLRALEYANRVRLARARMKRKVAAGELPAADIILTCPWQAHSMSISDLLMAQRRWGRARCKRLLVSLGVPENKQIGTLTERQRRALAMVLTAKGTGAGADRPAPASPPRPSAPALAPRRALFPV